MAEMCTHEIRMVNGITYVKRIKNRKLAYVAGESDYAWAIPKYDVDEEIPEYV